MREKIACAISTIFLVGLLVGMAVLVVSALGESQESQEYAPSEAQRPAGCVFVREAPGTVDTELVARGGQWQCAAPLRIENVDAE